MADIDKEVLTPVVLITEECKEICTRLHHRVDEAALNARLYPGVQYAVVCSDLGSAVCRSQCLPVVEEDARPTTSILADQIEELRASKGMIEVLAEDVTSSLFTSEDVSDKIVE